MNRRDLLRAAATVPLLAACTGKKKPDDAKPSPNGPLPLEEVGPHAAPGLEIGDAEAELLQGSARYAFGLISTADGPIAGAKATVYVGRDPAVPPTAEVQATELSEPGLAERGLYVAQVPFPEAGDYFVAIVAETSKGAMRGGTRVTVKKTSKAPAPGQKAPAVKTPTKQDPTGAKPLCSRKPVCTMHDISFDAAIKSGKPTLVVFAAPAFCRTELCGPDVEILQGVADKHAGKANFIHVEAYINATNPVDGKLAPPLKAFKFDSEPWLYVIDSKGVVTDRISGAYATSEVEDRLAKVLG